MAKGKYEHDPDMDYVVTKFVRDDESGKFIPARLEIHNIRMPAYNEPGWYTQGISIDAFRRRMQRRHVRIIRLADGCTAAQGFAVSFWFRCELRVEYEARRKIETHFNVDEQGSATDHPTLWDFYTAIGYDYKKNKLAVEPTRL